MKYFKVKNYKKYQHYKKRNPPWIKLYNNLLDDYEFLRLPNDLKYSFIAILLIASRHDNAIVWDEEFVGERIGTGGPVDLNALQVAGLIEEIDIDSIGLASVYQNDSLETEKRERRVKKDEDTY